MKYFLHVLLTSLLVGVGFGQQLDNSALTGDYGFVQLAGDVDGIGALSNVQTIGGTISFDGNGGFTFAAQSGVGGGSLQTVNGSGTYVVESSGILTLTNPLDSSATLNARIGESAEALTGSSTEIGSTTEDFFAAVKLPSGATNALLSGDYIASSLSLPAGSVLDVASALIELSSDAAGVLTAMQVSGHSAASGDQPLSETVAGSTYALTANGSGTVEFGTGSTLIGGAYNVFVSETGNYVLGHSSAAGGRSIVVAVRSLGSSSSDADFAGNFWYSEFNLELDRDKYVAGVSGLRANGDGLATVARRTHESTATGFGTFDDGLLLSSAIDSGSTGWFGFLDDRAGDNFGIGAPSGASTTLGVGQGVAPNGFVSAQVNSARLAKVHGILFGIRTPTTQPIGDVVLFPQGVLNAAAFAPTTYPVSPGTLLSLFGAGLAPGTSVAGSTPLPTSLSGVSVTIHGVPAPLFFVSAGQINLQTPFSLSGGQASIVVTNNGTLSNEVLAPVSETSPGVFSVNTSGIGDGIITHADFSLVSENNPAAPDEFVIIFLTGLGAVSPPFADGAPAPGAEPFARTVDQAISVEFGGEAGNVIFSGAAPNFIGLYQLNVQIPGTIFVGPAIPVAIITGNAFIDYVDIAIGL